MGRVIVIYEAILGVTADEGDLTARFAPMGVTPLDEQNEQNEQNEQSKQDEPHAQKSLLIRPFYSSKTGSFLLQKGRGIINFTDDVFLFALTALTDEVPRHNRAILDEACYWWEVTLDEASPDDDAQRWDIKLSVTKQGMKRPFLPFNRAKNAALEAVILATRAHLKPHDAIAQKINTLEEIAIKTGGEREIAAFNLIRKKLKKLKKLSG